MTDLESVIKQVRLQLGVTDAMKIRLELNEKDLTTVVDSSLRELTTFMDTPKIQTVLYEDAIDIKKYKIASVLNVLRAEPAAGAMQGVSLDPFYLSSAGVGVTQPGGIQTHGILQTQIQYAIRSMAQNTIQQDLDFLVDKYNQKLYVTYSGIRPNQVTIIFKPVVESVEDLPSDYWVTYLIRLSVAHSKVIIGRIRSKYSVQNSPFSVGIDILQEGITELQQIRDELRNLRGGVYD